MAKLFEHSIQYEEYFIILKITSQISQEHQTNLTQIGGTKIDTSFVFPKSKQTILNLFLKTGKIFDDYHDIFHSEESCSCPLCTSDPINGPMICSIKKPSRKIKQYTCVADVENN